jgi:hypothetical protein
MASENPSEEVQFQPKSSWQKNDCINNSAQHSCNNPATLEAVLGDARVRCCIKKECKNRAAEIARIINNN